jgi:hypothetical protein
LVNPALSREAAYKQKAISLSQSALAVYQKIGSPRGIMAVSLLSTSFSVVLNPTLTDGQNEIARQQNKILWRAIQILRRQNQKQRHQTQRNSLTGCIY